MIYKSDICTFEVTREHNNIIFHLLEYTTESGEIISLVNPCDMTYIISESIYNEARDLLDEYEENN